jgi:prepilin-type N-terminal cleavage/methylation domain-containing protein
MFSRKFVKPGAVKNLTKFFCAQYFDIVDAGAVASACRRATRTGPGRADAGRLAVHSTRGVEQGFSLLEMMISIVVLLAVMGTALSFMGFHQKVSQTTQLKDDMYESLRGATELMSQEIGQAGLVSLPTPLPTLAAAVFPNTVAQAVPVSSATSMFVGERLDVDTGASEEVVQLTAVVASTNTITAIFVNAHASGAVIKVLGNFWNGVMASSTGTQLKLLGDINSDGSLVFVEYTCAPAAANTPGGTLSRSITTVTPTTVAANASAVLLTNVVVNPGGTACFQYNTVSSPYTPVPATVTINGASYTFAPVWNVAITLTVQTADPDPMSGQYLQMTKALLNVAPRNVLMGLFAATQSPQITSVLQPTPPNVATW